MWMGNSTPLYSALPHAHRHPPSAHTKPTYPLILQTVTEGARELWEPSGTMRRCDRFSDRVNAGCWILLPLLSGVVYLEKRFDFL